MKGKPENDIIDIRDPSFARHDLTCTLLLAKYPYDKNKGECVCVCGVKHSLRNQVLVG